MTISIDALSAISFFSTSIFYKQSVEEVFWEITKSVIHKLGYEDCVIYTYDASTQLLHQVAAYGNKLGHADVINNQIDIPLGKGIVGECAQTKQSQLVVDTHLDKRYIVDDVPRRSELAVPIIVQEELFGVIDSEHSLPGFFGEEDVHVLTIVASLCAQKISDLIAKKPIQLREDNIYYKRFMEEMELKKLYKNPELSLETTATKFGISAGYFSKLINEITGKRFDTIVNEYRVNEVLASIKNKRFTHFSLLSIGLEAGFNSKASFHRNFKLVTGKTPSYFMKEG